MKYVCNKPYRKGDSPLSSISKNQILELQDIFLTNGVHVIEVATPEQGRLLIMTFLQALRCYVAPAILTRSLLPVADHVFNIKSHLDIYGYSLTWYTDEIDRFFIQEFECDFMWIEVAFCDRWHELFLQKIYELEVEQKMPIILTVAN